jgi:predicted small integral membrane protein
MWQSKIWNGQMAAFRMFVSILLVSIFIAQSDCEIN